MSGHAPTENLRAPSKMAKEEETEASFDPVSRKRSPVMREYRWPVECLESLNPPLKHGKQSSTEGTLHSLQRTKVVDLRSK